MFRFCIFGTWLSNFVDNDCFIGWSTCLISISWDNGASVHCFACLTLGLVGLLKHFSPCRIKISSGSKFQNSINLVAFTMEVKWCFHDGGSNSVEWKPWSSMNLTTKKNKPEILPGRRTEFLPLKVSKLLDWRLKRILIPAFIKVFPRTLWLCSFNEVPSWIIIRIGKW